MTITTAAQLETALGAGFSRIRGVKTTLTTGAGEFTSLWRVGAEPAQGAIPATTGSIPNHLTTGAMSFMQQTAPLKSYLAELQISVAVQTQSQTVEIHDRLLHQGGLNGTLTTAQLTAGCDLNAYLLTENIAARIGDANYSDIQWWIEWYTDTGATVVNTVVNVTYNDGTTGNLTTFAFGRRTGPLKPLNPFIPAADSGKYIRGVNSITLLATTGTVGSFGVTATRFRAAAVTTTQFKTVTTGWSETGLSEIYNNSCLTMIVVGTGTATSNTYVTGKIVHG